MSMSPSLLRAWALGVLLLAACTDRDPPPPPPVPVTVATAERRSVPFELAATGQVEPLQTVAVQSQVEGTLRRIAFTEGDEVKRGQVLFELDSRPYRASLDQALAALVRDSAQAANAAEDASRYQALAEKQYVTTQQYEQIRTTAAASRATLAGSRAAVEVGAAQPAVRHDPGADYRPDRQLVAAGRQPGAGQFGAAVGHDQPDPAHPGPLRGPRPEPAFTSGASREGHGDPRRAGRWG